MVPPEPPKRRPPSHSDLKPILDQTPENQVVDQRRFDAPKRAKTLTGLPAPVAPGSVPPPAPALPLEYQATARPPMPWSKTIRAPTPPEVLAQARRGPPPLPLAGAIRAVDELQGVRIQTPPSGQPSASLPPPSQSPDGAALDALRRRAEAAEIRNHELERRERVRTEAASSATWPPKVERRTGEAEPRSTPPHAAIGKSVTYLFGKLWPLFVAAAGIGGGVTAIAKPAADPAKADAVLASQQAMRADVALLTEQVAGMLKREAARDQYVRCLEESLDEVGEQLLPAQDRLSNASPLRAYVKRRCERLRP